jgi:hypothetical protein
MSYFLVLDEIYLRLSLQKFTSFSASSGGFLKASAFGKLCNFMDSSNNLSGNESWTI